ncbi:MAG: hypothetical protein ACK6D3_18360 [Planctomycetaceae bacterium]
MVNSPKDSCQPTTAVPDPSWKSHPEFRRLWIRLRLLGAVGLLLLLFAVVGNYRQFQKNAVLNDRLSQKTQELFRVRHENEALIQQLNGTYTTP